MTNIGKIVLIISLFLIIISGGCIEKKSLVEQLSEPKSAESFATSIENGLVGEWHFDGNAQDSSGNGYHGTIYGAAFVEGISGKALQFDGVGDVVLTNNFPVYANEPFTIETWVYPTSTSNDYNTIIGHNRHYPDNVYSWGMLSGVPSQVDKWTIFMPSPGYLYGSTHRINQWYHLAMVFDGSRVSLYVNGFIDINPVAASYSSQNIPVAIGRFYYDLSSSSFNGIIDEVRIYNRALSAEEIKAEYLKYAGKAQAKTQITSTPAVTLPPPTVNLPTEITLGVGDDWHFDGWKNGWKGWQITAQAIDTKASPRMVWLIFSYEGRKEDDVVLSEGELYRYRGKSDLFYYRNLQYEVMYYDDRAFPFEVFVEAIFAGKTTDQVRLRLVPIGITPTVSTPIEWWKTEEGINSLAQSLLKKHNALSYETYKNDKYILILLTTDIKKETIFNYETDIPVYKVALFDLSTKKFLSGTDSNREIVFDLYRQYYLEKNKEDIIRGWLGKNAGYTQVISKSVKELKDTANSPFVAYSEIGIAMSALGEATLVAIVSENPALAKAKLEDSVLKVATSLAEAASVVLSKEDESKAKDVSNAFEKLADAGKYYSALKTAFKTVKKGSEFVSYFNHYLKASQDYKLWHDLAISNIRDTSGILIGTLTEYVFPTGSIAKSAFYLDFVGVEAEYANNALDKAIESAQKFEVNPTVENYDNIHLYSIMAFDGLNNGYDLFAKALEENKKGLTGWGAKQIHDYLNDLPLPWLSKLDVDEQIEAIKTKKENMNDWSNLMIRNQMTMNFWASGAADAEFISDPINYVTVEKEEGFFSKIYTSFLDLINRIIPSKKQTFLKELQKEVEER